MKNYNSKILIFLFICAIVLLFWFYTNDKGIFLKEIGDFSSIFTSILIEAIPFIIIGALVSAIIQTCISEKFIAKLVPNSNTVGYLVAALIGLIFPICECAIVPITRRLIKKGMPVGFGVTFMLAVPIINPVVIMSTYYAFYDKIIMVFIRVIGGIVGAILIGIIVNALENSGQPVIMDFFESEAYCNCGCNSFVENQNKFRAVIEHTNREFLDIMGYLIFGAFISSLFQIIVPHGNMDFLSNNKVFGIIIMMLLGFFLSLCSEVDAFVGRSFLSNYSFCGVAAFLILGPMLDLKNLIMLIGAFKKGFVFKLTLTTVSIVFCISFLYMLCGL